MCGVLLMIADSVLTDVKQTCKFNNRLPIGNILKPRLKSVH